MSWLGEWWDSRCTAIKNREKPTGPSAESHHEWADEYTTIGLFIDNAKVDDKGTAAVRKLMAFFVRDLLDQADFDDWRVFKNTLNASGRMIDFVGNVEDFERNARKNNLPAAALAYELIRINIATSTVNDPVAVICEQLTDGFIERAVSDFPTLE